MSTKRDVMIIAGEASGDLHAANLIHEVARKGNAVRFYGIGGTRMREAGVETLVDSREMAVMGLVEVLAHYRRLSGILKQMQRLLAERRPDLLVLVDYPGFNLRLAKSAKALGIPVLFYISPQVWAWRQGRIKSIARRVDMMAVIFPFETAFYEQAGVPVRYVGHPLVSEAHSDLSREQALSSFGLEPQRPTLGLFPGSRRSELQRLMPVLLDSATLLRAHHPQLQLLLPLASSLDESDLAPYLGDNPLGVTVVPNRPYDVMRGCDAIVSASGTATLEIALIGTPLAVIYKVAPLSYALMRRLIKVPHIALCNIVAGEAVAAELIQDAATPERIVEEAERLLFDRQYAQSMREALGRVGEKLGTEDGSKGAAELLLEMLDTA